MSLGVLGLIDIINLVTAAMAAFPTLLPLMTNNSQSLNYNQQSNDLSQSVLSLFGWSSPLIITCKNTQQFNNDSQLHQQQPALRRSATGPDWHNDSTGSKEGQVWKKDQLLIIYRNHIWNRRWVLDSFLSGFDSHSGHIIVGPLISMGIPDERRRDGDEDQEEPGTETMVNLLLRIL